jgi:hypothetical protein
LTLLVKYSIDLQLCLETTVGNWHSFDERKEDENWDDRNDDGEINTILGLIGTALKGLIL